jgi:hypothetical protein
MLRKKTNIKKTPQSFKKKEFTAPLSLKQRSLPMPHKTKELNKPLNLLNKGIYRFPILKQRNLPMPNIFKKRTQSMPLSIANRENKASEEKFSLKKRNSAQGGVSNQKKLKFQYRRDSMPLPELSPPQIGDSEENNNYNIFCPSKIVFDKNLSAEEIHTYLIISTFLEKDGYAVCSDKLLAEKKGCHESTIKKNLKSLETKGYIYRQTWKEGMYWKRRIFLVSGGEL